MKTASANLIALLNTATEAYHADLYTFTLIDGSIYRFTSAETDLITGGNTFQTAGPLLQRGKVRTVIGLQVDSLDVSIFADENILLNGVPWLKAITNGVLDGAYLKLERAIMPTWGDLTNGGTLISFMGRVSEIVVSRTEAKLTVNSDLELLNIQIPRNLYQPGCVHTLYDTGCTLNRASYAISTTVSSTSTTSSVNASALTQAAGYFDLGVLQFTTGQNAGVRRTVKSFSPGVVSLSYPLPYAPAISDSFTIWPGCDKQKDTCDTKFANKANFKGMPYIPQPENAL